MDLSLIYPRWRYHPSGKAQIVATEAENLGLGPDWADFPFKSPSQDDQLRAADKAKAIRNKDHVALLERIQPAVETLKRKKEELEWRRALLGKEMANRPLRVYVSESAEDITPGFCEDCGARIEKPARFCDHCRPLVHFFTSE